MIDKIHKNDVTRNDIQDIYRKIADFSKDVNLLETKIKFTVSLLENTVY